MLSGPYWRHGGVNLRSRSGDKWRADLQAPAMADVFDHIERLYNAKRRHSTIGYLSPVAFEEQAALA